jgi:uncharacterized protein YcnI
MRLAVLAAPTAAAVLLLAVPASAHVTVHADDPHQGATDVKVSFRVPNESDKATTTKVQIFFPTDHPLVSVLVEPTPGWTVATTSATLAKPVKTDDGTITSAVSEVTWTGSHIPVGGFQDFNVVTGVLPDASSLTFKALQTYSDGNVVRWIQTVPPGAPEPDSPAPILTLLPAENTTSTTAVPPSSTPSAAAPASTPVSATKASSDSTARTLGAIGIGLAIVLGGAGLTLGLAARRRSRGTTSAAR